MRLQAAIKRHGDEIIGAISKDFGGRAEYETTLAELAYVFLEIRQVRKRLKRWMRTRRVSTSPLYFPGKNRLVVQPLGVVGVISPWNYPLQLAILPTISAIAAGNTVMIKVSELTPFFGELLREIISANFEVGELAVSLGDAQIANAFASLPFDHLLFTGSTETGRKVAQSAAKNLTPLTLELGGKSPAIIDQSCNITEVINRIVFGKLFNGGQTCIAPDYILVPANSINTFVDAFWLSVKKLYPSLFNNPEYTCIINDWHYKRLQELLEDARLKGARIIQMHSDSMLLTSAERRFPPTLILDVTEQMKIMQEEIFGPLLPVVSYQHFDEAIEFINRRDQPLAIYWFGKDAKHQDLVLHNTISGGVALNDCLFHQAQELQPFGGVGSSGYGAYHGEWGFQTFSKLKPIFYQSRYSPLRLIYPPYKNGALRILRWLRKWVF